MSHTKRQIIWRFSTRVEISTRYTELNRVYQVSTRYTDYINLVYRVYQHGMKI